MKTITCTGQQSRDDPHRSGSSDTSRSDTSEGTTETPPTQPQPPVVPPRKSHVKSAPKVSYSMFSCIPYSCMRNFLTSNGLKPSRSRSKR